MDSSEIWRGELLRYAVASSLLFFKYSVRQASLQRCFNESIEFIINEQLPLSQNTVIPRFRTQLVKSKGDVNPVTKQA